MKTFKYTLLTDGSSDKTLIFIIDWLLKDLYPQFIFRGEFADLRNLKTPPKTLAAKIASVNNLYTFDLLFIHRDAEELITDTSIINKRKLEIEEALTDLTQLKPLTIGIVPVKMMETWLLINEEAIKKAAGNRNSKARLELPPINRLELIQEPKNLLHKIISDASELSGRNLKKLNTSQAIHFLAEYIEDYSCLRELQSFQSFEQDVERIISDFIEKNYEK